MKKIIIGENYYYYDEKTEFLYYDSKRVKRTPFYIFNATEYKEFLKQIQ